MLRGFGERACTAGGDLVVPPRWSLLALRDGLRLPSRPHVPVALEAPEDGIHGPARETGGIHDVESVADGAADGAEDGERGKRQRFHEGARVTCMCWCYLCSNNTQIRPIPHADGCPGVRTETVSLRAERTTGRRLLRRPVVSTMCLDAARWPRLGRLLVLIVERVRGDHVRSQEINPAVPVRQGDLEGDLIATGLREEDVRE